MKVDFYHLTSTPLARALPQIAARVAAEGGRLLIVAAEAQQRAEVDALLWTFTADSFLAHGQIGGANDADEPILIAPDINAANGARFVAIVDGQWRDGALDFDRTFHFFDDEQILGARGAWKSLSDNDAVERRYWKQNDAGRWEQAA